MSLRNLYFTRFAFAAAWAGLILATASGAGSGGTIGAGIAVLLVIYPLFDAASAVIDLRHSRKSSADGAPGAAPLYVNIVVSLAAAVGLAVVSAVPGALRVWGAWAITAGVVQLVVAVLRRRIGGQWPLILSGGISVLAGGSFVAMAGGANPSLTSVAGYATLGGIFFLISALRLRRTGALGLAG